jgi:hypothetical protein
MAYLLRLRLCGLFVGLAAPVAMYITTSNTLHNKIAIYIGIMLVQSWYASV